MTTPADLVVAPSTPALLPGYAALADPVADVRAASLEAVSWLAGRHPDRIILLASDARPDNAARGVPTSAGERVGRHLLAAVGFTGAVVADGEAGAGQGAGPGAGPGAGRGAGVLAVADGSAKRSEKAPGHLDERSFSFDAGIGRALRDGDPHGLCAVDGRLGEELWAYDVPVLRRVGHLVARPSEVVVDFEGDPFGVQYWVVRWSCGS